MSKKNKIATSGGEFLKTNFQKQMSKSKKNKIAASDEELLN